MATTISGTLVHPVTNMLTWYWDSGTSSWVKGTQPQGGTGGTASSFGAAFPATGTAMGFKDSTGTNMAAGNLDASGNLKVAGTFSSTPPSAATATLSNVTGATSNTTVLASNASRLGFTLYNDSTSAVYVKCGATASATSFTKYMLPQEVWTTANLGINYTGKLDAIWVSVNGAMRVTELTA
jgi:hypothetical protein